MLLSLSIQQLAIVDHLELDFKPGMTVITGETGAGKSILLSALGLALGDRADSDSVRHGAQRAEITARFDITHLAEARDWLAEHELETRECILRRSLLANGRSKAWINGQPCPVQHLKELGELLMDIHGQHAHQSLLRRDHHLRLLDHYAGLDHRLTQVETLFQLWQKAQRQLKQFDTQDAAQQAKIQLLSYQVAELDQLNLHAGELEELEAEQHQLAHAESLIQTSQEALDLCDHDEGAALQAVNQALHKLSSLQHPALTDIAQLLSEAQIQLQETSRELSHFLGQLELDPQRLLWVEERLSQVYQVARKHQIDPAALPEHHQQLQQTLHDLMGPEGGREALEAELIHLEQMYLEQAEALSHARQEAARQLEAAVDQQLAHLGMEKSQFKLAFQRAAHYQASGLDEVEFLIAPNPGQPAKPLIRIASGGELSRISLAIQVVTAQTSSIPTLVFDEVDVGISGATAEIVGRLLHQLAQRGQILCVTHLPQVAAQGDQHLHIHKESDEHSTLTRMQLLDQAGRIAELARMLGGIHLSAQTLAHAQEMLQSRHH